MRLLLVSYLRCVRFFLQNPSGLLDFDVQGEKETDRQTETYGQTETEREIPRETETETDRPSRS